MEKEKLYVIKIGGSLIDNEENLSKFLAVFAEIKSKKILVHGGGKLATEMAKNLNIPQELNNGRRITSSETLDIVTMVYAGKINKNIVVKLQNFHCNAMGFSGADGNLIKAEKREISDIDYGFVGDVEAKSINFQLLKSLLDLDLVPVFSAITHDQKGQLFNTNADSVASVLAQALSQNYNVELLYCFDRNGVLENPNDSASVIKNLNIEKYEELKAAQKLTEGILPKLKNAFLAKENQVAKVFLMNESNLQNHFNQENDGTEIKI